MKRILTAVFVLAFATAVHAEAPAVRADGAVTFAAKCKMCHGADGTGGAMFKGSLKGQKEADVLKIINEGKGKMKPVKIDDAAAVAKYVSGLK
jgi:mono/diheme cytochrome c family protein